MSELNPYKAPGENAVPTETKVLVHTTRLSAFWAGARRGAKLAVVIAFIGQSVLFGGVIAFDRILRQSIVDDFRKDPGGTFALWLLLFFLLPLMVAFFGAFGMGRVEAKRWRPPEF
jgi:hypothetical protein